MRLPLSGVGEAQAGCRRNIGLVSPSALERCAQGARKFTIAWERCLSRKKKLDAESPCASLNVDQSVVMEIEYVSTRLVETVLCIPAIERYQSMWLVA